MKNTKQLLIAAVAVSMSLNAMADITISGEAKVNAKGGDYSREADLTITGKSGDTSFFSRLSLDNSNTVEQLYMTSKVAGIDIKVGEWDVKKSELNTRYFGHLVGLRIQASTSYGGVKLTYQDSSGPDGTKVAVAGKIGGFETMIKKHPNKTEAKLSGSIGGIDIDAHSKVYDRLPDGSGGSYRDLDTSITLKTSVQGVDFTYVNTESDAGTSMWGFIGKNMNVTEANAFGVSANILGNKITYKDTSINGWDNKKLIVTRKIASGATFEATYNDNEDSLDLELAVKF